MILFNATVLPAPDGGSVSRCSFHSGSAVLRIPDLTGRFLDHKSYGGYYNDVLNGTGDQHVWSVHGIRVLLQLAEVSFHI